MRTVGPVRSLFTLGTNDHVCWPYDDLSSLSANVVEFLSDGVARGLRVAYAGPGDRIELEARVAGLTDVDRLLTSGGLEFIALDEVYGPESSVDADAAVAAYAAATEKALADGYRGFRVGADVTQMVRSPEQLDSFTRYEARVDRYAAAHPFSAMCAYDVQLGPEALAEIASVHPVSPAALTPFHVFSTADGALGVAGEVDLFSAEQFRQALERIRLAPHATAVVWDLSAAAFLDHHALAAMDAVAGRLGLPGLVHGAPRIVRRLMQLVPLSHLRIVDAEPAP